MYIDIHVKITFVVPCSGGRKYLFLAGMWCSTRKPPTLQFLKPIMESLNKLTTEGMQCMTVYINFNITMWFIELAPPSMPLSCCSSTPGKGGGYVYYIWQRSLKYCT